MSRLSGDSRPSGASNMLPGDNISDDDDRCVPPRMQGGRLTYSFPMSTPVYCLVNNCKTNFKSKTWSIVVNNYSRHLRDIHKIKIESKVLWCSICQIDLGKQVATHECFRERPILVSSNKKLRYACDQMPRDLR